MNASALPDLVGCAGMKSRQKRTSSPAIAAGQISMPAEHDRPDRVEPEGEAGDDAEVAAAAAQPPEQVGVLGVGRVTTAPVGGDDLGFDQVVAREPELALEPTAAAAEREPAMPVSARARR